MLQNFLRIAIRHWRKRKGYSALNIFGLTAGIVCCLLIFEYVGYERSYDGFSEKTGRIVRVQDEEWQKGRMVVPCASAMPALAPALKREVPEVEDACRINVDGFLLSNDERHVRFREGSVYMADPSVLDLFRLQLIRGDAKTALSGPGKIVISETEAKKYFGGADVLGKVLTIHGTESLRPLEVTGVFRDYPENSHLKFEIIVSYATRSQINGSYGRPNDPIETSWDWTDFYTYVLLRKGADAKQLEAKANALMDHYYNELPQNKLVGVKYTLSVMPLKDIHLSSHYTEEISPNGDGQAVYFLFLIAFFIMGIAWVNYINLATARSLERAREVGVRKVLGAMRGELIGQFMLESLLFNLVALLVAFGLTLAVNPLFARLTGRPMSGFIGLPSAYWAYFAALFVCGTFLSGFYPALVLSRYTPVKVLKGLFKNASGGQWLRKGLIVGQFAASIILIAGTLVVFRQMRYMRNVPLGAEIDQTVVLPGAGSGLPDSAYDGVYGAFRNELLRIPGVRGVAASSAVMGKEILWSTDWYLAGAADRHAVNLFHLGVDDQYIRNYGLRVIAGRDFSRDYGTDRKGVILNLTAVKAFGFLSPDAAIGRLVKGGQWRDTFHVVGVIADFHNEGLQKAIQPLALLPHRDRRGYYSVKMVGGDPTETLAAIKALWTNYFPGDPYSYFFLDEFFGRQYAENQRFGEVFALFALLTIAIACIGLLGLSAYNVLQRTKEIGIRKVLGASVGNLLFILSRDFVLLVGIAFVIAIPVTWLAMDSWLRGFAYRTGLSWWIFGLTGLLAVLVAFLTVSGQAAKAAMANPVKSLRNE